MADDARDIPVADTNAAPHGTLAAAERGSRVGPTGFFDASAPVLR
jgi:hypothetical protein